MIPGARRHGASPVRHSRLDESRLTNHFTLGEKAPAFNNNVYYVGFQTNNPMRRKKPQRGNALGLRMLRGTTAPPDVLALRSTCTQLLLVVIK
jgi:hypothetical protein